MDSPPHDRLLVCFHMHGASARLEFGTKANSGDVWQSNNVFKLNRPWYSLIDHQKK